MRTRSGEGGREKARPVTRRRGGHWGATGKDGRVLLKSLKPRVEGYEMEILTNLAFRDPVNRVTCMRKTQALNALTVVGLRERWNARTAVDSGDTPWHFPARRTKFHWGSRRSANGTSQNISLGQKIATTKGNVTASWRQRNLRSGWRVLQYSLMTLLRQRWRLAISQLIDVIL